jgi:uncharacterized protein
LKVAIVGAGISGIAAAHGLQDQADVTLFEAERRLGGHTDTHAILSGDRTYRVDSGFIVFNHENYPGFSAWLAELGVSSRPSDMSFGVSNRLTGVEYGTSTLDALFCQRRNLASPAFLAMLRDLRRFYAQAGAVTGDDVRTLGEYLSAGGYGPAFVDNHMAPMCAALWSLPPMRALDVPVAHVVAFMTQHRMLQVRDRPEWRVVDGGSSRYVSAFTERFRGRIVTGDPVLAVARQGQQAQITTRTGRHAFDAVVLACHSDQALALLQDPTAAERDILGAIPYQQNRVVVHSDPTVMPVNRRAWSSWNAVVDEHRDLSCQVSYWMNRLQSLGDDQQFFVTLNPPRALSDVWCTRSYAHPVFTPEARRAQHRRDEISGVGNTWYCGAYWGWGFHEDGFSSGMAVAHDLRGAMARAA